MFLCLCTVCFICDDNVVWLKSQAQGKYLIHMVAKPGVGRNRGWAMGKSRRAHNSGPPVRSTPTADSDVHLPPMETRPPIEASDHVIAETSTGRLPQVNPWTPQTELTQQELRGAQLVMSGQMQRLIESAEIELMKVIVSFRNLLDTRAAEKTLSDERLTQDIQHLMIQLHQKFVEVDTAVATISSMQTASSQTGSQPAPQAAHSSYRKLLQVQQRSGARTRGLPRHARSRMSDTTPHGKSADPAK